MESQTEQDFIIKDLTKKEQRVFYNNIKQIEQENKKFIQEQANENINLLFCQKDKHRKIKQEMDKRILEGLK